MRKGSSLSRKALCHPERPHFCRGKCLQCYRTEYDRNRYESRKEETKYRTSQYKKDNPEKVSVWGKRYRKGNNSKEALRHKKYNTENREKVSEREKVYRDKSKVKIQQKGMAYYKANPEKHREKRLKKYGLTIKDYDTMLLLQKGKCAICSGNNKGRNFHVDHDHETGKTRGLLCNSCNIGLGMMKDNPEILKNAIKYIRKHKK